MGFCFGLHAAMAATNAVVTVATPLAEQKEGTPAAVGQPAAVSEDFESGFARVLALQQAAEFREAIQLGTTLEEGHKNDPDVGKLAEVLRQLNEQKRKATQLSFAVETLGSEAPREVQAAKEQLAEDPELTALLLRRVVRKGSGTAAIGAITTLGETPDAKSAAVLADRMAVEPPGRLAQALSASLVRQVEGLAEQSEADRGALADSLGLLYRKVEVDAGLGRPDFAGLLLLVLSDWFHGQAASFDTFLHQPGAYTGLSGYVTRAYASTNAELVTWAYWGLNALGKENTSGLVGWWQFDEAEGSVARDSSPRKQDGTLTGGVTRCAGRIKGGLSFDGVGAQVLPPGTLFADVTNTFTMALWASPSASRLPAVEHENGVDINTHDQRYAIYPTIGIVYGEGQAGAGLSIGDNGISVVEHTGNYIPALLVYTGAVTGWTHVAVVYQDRQPSLYVNGELVKTGLVSTMTVHPSASLGCYAGGYGCYAGLLDDVRVYNRALSAKEIKGLVQACGTAAPEVGRR